MMPDLCQKMYKNDKLNHLFPENPKLHGMNTRSSKKYEVQFAHTGRLEKSPFIYMQNLLNQDYKNKLKFMMSMVNFVCAFSYITL